MKVQVIYLFLVVVGNIYAQNCNCDIVLSGLSEKKVNVISASDLVYGPGSIICIPQGNYAGIEFSGFRGNPEEPVIIKNCDGQVVINESEKSALTFRNSSFIRLFGNGDANTTYGIYIEAASAPGTVGVNLANFSTDIEIAHLEIANTGFAGILGKTDPSCDNVSSWRRSGFVMRNINIHDNYIHDTKGEAIYLGSTGGYLFRSNLKCNEEAVFAHWLENITVHRNNLKNIGWDGIQLNLVRKSGKIYNNKIEGYGLEDVTFQTFAMSLGGGEYEVFNNWIQNFEGGDGQGIQLISGRSGTKLFNNIIINPQLHGIFVHNRHKFDSDAIGYYILNNTIVKPELSGVFYNTIITESSDESLISTSQENVPSFFINNLIINPGNVYEESNTWKGKKENYFDFNTRTTRDALRNNIINNITTRDINGLCLAAPDNYDFRPASELSPLVNEGRDLRPLGVLTDYDGNMRFENGGMDIGALEFQGEVLNFNCYTFNEDIFQSPIFETERSVAFPNPAKNEVQFFNSEYDLTILSLFSSDGSLVLQMPYKFGEKLSISNYPKGLYYVTFDISDSQEVIKLLIE